MREVKRWVYKDKIGQPYGHVSRLENENNLGGSKSRKQIIPHFNTNGQAGIPDEFPRSKRLFGMDTVKDTASPVFIVEGEKCAGVLQELNYQAVTNLGGCQQAHLADWSQLDGIEKVYLLPDNDDIGEKFIKGVFERIKKFKDKPKVKILRCADLGSKADIVDWLKQLPELENWDELTSLVNHDSVQQIRDTFEQFYINCSEHIPTEWKYTVTSHGLRSITLEDFQQIKFPKRRKLLSPWLDERSINMIFADRGIGKTFFALSCATALANESQFLKYKANEAVPVMYLDGEMQAPLMQDRFKGLVTSGFTKAPLHIVTPDCQNIDEMPDLGTPKGQKEIDELIYKLRPSVIFIDNLSTFIRSGNENEGESWLPVQSWAIRHRSEGRTIIFVHHTNKEGKQRGSHRKEDVMDVVIQLKRPDDYVKETDGARFQIHYTKGRSLYGEDAQPMEANLTEEDGKPIWNYQAADGDYAYAVDLLKEGISITAIAEELGKNKSTVSRWRKKALSEGILG